MPLNQTTGLQLGPEIHDETLIFFLFSFVRDAVQMAVCLEIVRLADDVRVNTA